MKLAFRNAYFTLSRSLNPNLKLLITLLSLPRFSTVTPFNSRSGHYAFYPISACSYSAFSSMADAETDAPHPSSLEKQFENFRHHLEESGSLRDRIRAVAMEIESATRLMQASLLLVHQSRPLPEVLEKAKAQINVLKGLYNRLAEVLCECPGQYHRYHGDWRTETQTVVSLLAFMHWLESGSLLMHNEADEQLGFFIIGEALFGLFPIRRVFPGISMAF